MAEVDLDKFMAFVHKFAGDLGATVAAGGVVIGDRLGLYRALASGGPTTAAELADRTNTDPRYVAEWLAGQASGGYVEYEQATDAYSLTPEQALALANPDGPVSLPGAFTLALGPLAAVPAVTEAFRTGEGMGWHEQRTTRQIGDTLFISPRTVEMHVRGSLLKLSCRTRAEAVRRLAELDAVPPAGPAPTR